MAVKGSNFAQKNNTFSGAEESNIQFQSRNSYPYNMQTVIQDYLESVNYELLSFVNDVEKGDRKFKRLNLSDVSDKQVKDINKLLNIDISGYKNAINTSAIVHILKRHGKNGQQDHSMQNSKDIARIAYILNNYDNAELLKDDNGQIKTADGFVDKNNQNSSLIVFTKN